MRVRLVRNLGISLLTMVSLLISCDLLVPPEAGSCDYAVVHTVFPGTGYIGRTFTGSFTIQNGGTAAGIESVGWKVLLSNDVTEDENDTVVGQGEIAALNVGAGSSSLNFTGVWPNVTEDVYLIINIESSEDAFAANNRSISGGVSLSYAVTDGVDYYITQPEYPGNGLTGHTVDGSFHIANAGNVSGVHDVDWSVYISQDDALDSGDSLAQSDTLTSGLQAGTISSAIAYTITWPVDAGSYYLITVLDCPDDSIAENDQIVSDVINVSIDHSTIVDYGIVGPFYPTVGVAYQTFESTFCFRNFGMQDGQEDISWSLHISSDTVLDDGDTELAQGTISPLPGDEVSTSIGFSGDWPDITAAANYYLVYSLDADDDAVADNDVLISSPIPVTASRRFLAVGENGQVSYSDDGGDSWTTDSLFLNTLHAIAVGDRRVVTVGDNGKAFFSDDSGESWTESVTGIDTSITGVVYGNDMFLAFSGTTALSSADASSGSWTAVTTDQSLKNGCFGDGYFAAVGGSGIWNLAWTTNGVDWTYAAGNQAEDVVRGSGFFVAVGGDTTGGTFHEISFSFGVTEDIGSVNLLGNSTGRFLKSIAYDGALRVVAVGTGGTIRYSDNNGSTWTSSMYDGATRWNICYGDANWARYLSVGDGGETWYSSDGITWTGPISTGTANSLKGVVYLAE